MTKKNRNKNNSNGFFKYMQVMRPILEKQHGRILSGEEVASFTAPFWNKLTSEEKMNNRPSKNHIPCDSFGVPLYVHREKAEMASKLQEDITHAVSDLVNMHVSANSLLQLEFITIAVNTYITTAEGQVFPAELSLVRVTLEGGLDPKLYHAILNPPDRFPIGYYHEVHELVRKTHRLPLINKEYVGTIRFNVVANDIRKFLAPDDASSDLSPVYTLDEHLMVTRTVLRDSFNMQGVQVRPLEELLCTVYRALFPEYQALYTNTHARDELVNNAASPEYHSALGCRWHREESPDEACYCSLNMAQRWSYMFLHALDLKTSFGIKLLVGRHWAGKNESEGQLVQISTFKEKSNQRRRIASMQSINTMTEGPSGVDTDYNSDAAASSSKKKKGWGAPPASGAAAAASNSYTPLFQPEDISIHTESVAHFPGLGAVRSRASVPGSAPGAKPKKKIENKTNASGVGRGVGIPNSENGRRVRSATVGRASLVSTARLLLTPTPTPTPAPSSTSSDDESLHQNLNSLNLDGRVSESTERLQLGRGQRGGLRGPPQAFGRGRKLN